MRLGMDMSLGAGGVTPLMRALGDVPNADLFARFDNELGAGGLYYSGSAIKTFADVIASGPTGEPTSAGMLIDGIDAPTLVQGAGPAPYPDYFGTEHTLFISWDADSVTGDRVVCEIRKDANNRILLHFVSGVLRLESFVGGISEGFVAVAGVDDGGSHSAVLYWDEVSGTLSLDVDGQGLEGPELVTNGGFDTDTDWTKLGSAQISGGTANTASGGGWYQLLSVIEGVVYRTAFDIAAYTSGSVTPYFSGGTQVSGTARLAVGSYTEDLVSDTGNTAYQFSSGGGSVLAIDNASLKATYTRTGLTLPTNLSQIALGHSGGANQLNGYVLELAAANGNQAWT